MAAPLTYETAFEDHQYLWRSYGPARDMTGGYVDQDDLALMLAHPTRHQARACLINQIEYWFDVGPEEGTDIVDHHDERLLAIADRYNRELPL